MKLGIVLTVMGLTDACWWRKSEQVTKRRAYPLLAKPIKQKPIIRPTKGKNFL